MAVTSTTIRNAKPHVPVPAAYVATRSRRRFRFVTIRDRYILHRRRTRPCTTTIFDFILLASLFTHMLPDQVESHVVEISDLLKSGGVCIASYFLLNDESRAGVEAGRSFVTVDVLQTSRVCRLHNEVVPEAAVASAETFVRASLEAKGAIG